MFNSLREIDKRLNEKYKKACDIYGYREWLFFEKTRYERGCYALDWERAKDFEKFLDYVLEVHRKISIIIKNDEKYTIDDAIEVNDVRETFKMKSLFGYNDSDEKRQIFMGRLDSLVSKSKNKKCIIL